jgi:regulatory protein
VKPPKGSEPDAQAGGDIKAVQTAALRLLARREHSSEELKRKLIAKGHPAETVAAVVAVLGDKRLVSDDRFVASYVHHHATRGQGPVRIRAELRQHGVADGAIEEKIENAGTDWTRLAEQVRARKFGAGRPATLAERAKQARFLQYRGFTAEQIRAAFKSSESGEEQDVHGLDLDF